MKQVNKNDPKLKKVGIVFGIIVVLLLVIIAIGRKQEQKPDTTDLVRKCAVMEAADIRRSGVGAKSHNPFSDGRDQCNDWLVEWGEDDFVEAVTTDWEKEKDEELEGHTLQYYYENLGW